MDGDRTLRHRMRKHVECFPTLFICGTCASSIAEIDHAFPLDGPACVALAPMLIAQSTRCSLQKHRNMLCPPAKHDVASHSCMCFP